MAEQKRTVSFTIFVISIVIAIILGIAISFGIFSITAPSGEIRTVTTTIFEEMLVPSIFVSDQEIMDDKVTIDVVYLDKPGYVVIHLVTEEGKPGQVIGRSELLEKGKYTNLQIQIENYEGREELIAMLHYDNGDGMYEFPGPDLPIKINDKIVLVKFKIM